ncbi:MAG: putative glycosyltransferase, exosortase G system-associated, partial [Saccharofermentans sp.]|nr:putative glycosyltransferase, exosortase G system-associated [Saccharofermentans sp.]
ALLFDHTFAFPRMIWYLAIIFLMVLGYSSKVVLVSMGAIFLFYIICGYLYFYIAQYLLKPFKETRRYYMRRWADVALLPFYNFAIFFVRFAGIINSINSKSNWKTDTLTDEWDKFTESFRNSLGKVRGVLEKLRKAVNYEDKFNG